MAPNQPMDKAAVNVKQIYENLKRRTKDEYFALFDCNTQIFKEK